MKAKERLEDLQAQLDALDADELWQRWLKARRHHRRRSWRNQLLIALQRPDATQCEGFSIWRDKFNRQVVKGAKAIWILAPAPYQVEAETADGTVEAQTRTSFKPVCVFDVADTRAIDGKPGIPVEPPLEPITGDSHEHLWAPLCKSMLDAGVLDVLIETMPGRQRGYYKPAERLVALSDDCCPNELIAVAVHELCHHLIREKLERGDWPDGYAAEEVLVESTTYVVCASIGLDTGEQSAKYVQAWGADDVRQLVQRVDELAAMIETGLEAHTTIKEPASA